MALKKQELWRQLREQEWEAAARSTRPPRRRQLRLLDAVRSSLGLGVADAHLPRS